MNSRASTIERQKSCDKDSKPLIDINGDVQASKSVPGNLTEHCMLWRGNVSVLGDINDGKVDVKYTWWAEKRGQYKATFWV